MAVAQPIVRSGHNVLYSGQDFWSECLNIRNHAQDVVESESWFVNDTSRCGSLQAIQRARAYGTPSFALHGSRHSPQMGYDAQGDWPSLS